MTTADKIIENNTTWSTTFVPSPDSDILNTGNCDMSNLFPSVFLDIAVLKDGSRIILAENIYKLFPRKYLLELLPFMEKEYPDIAEQIKNPINFKL